jgi:hypothetical protein
MNTGNEPPVPADDHRPGRTSAEQTRNGKGNFAPRLDTAKRDARAAELRAERWKLADIATELGYHDATHARQGIQRALRAIVQGPAEKLLALYIDRLEDIFQRSMEISEADHVVVSHGKIVCDDTGNPLRDHGAALAAFREARAALADVRKMVGLDQPAKVTLSGSVKYEVVGVDTTDLT